MKTYRLSLETCELCRLKIKYIIDQIPDAAVQPKPKRTSCCQARQKVIVAVAKILTKEECGIPDSLLADYVDHGTDSPGGKPVLAFQFCPWCGAKRDPEGETRITEEA
jgi:hypothetical protein